MSDRPNEILRGVLTIAILAPLVFAWAYIRPPQLTALETILGAALAVAMSLGTYYVAGLVLSRWRR